MTTWSSDSSHDMWAIAIDNCKKQDSQALPTDDLRNFDVKSESRRLTDGETVLMTTWSKYELVDGVQKYELWTTLADEFHKGIAAAGANLLDPNTSSDEFRIALNNRANQFLGMSEDSGVKEADVRKVWVAEVPVIQADVEKVFAKEATEGFFRPCLDSPSIHTDSCHYTEPSYDWIKNWTDKAWNTSPDSKGAYPFTGEGYTYNWQ